MSNAATKTARGTLTVKTSGGGSYTGKPATYAVYVYNPRPGFMPWQVLEGGFGSYTEACERMAALRAAA